MKGRVILVTGFGAFPGAPQNPTALLMNNLALLEGRLRRLDIKLVRRVLPVVYDEISPRLEKLVAEIDPDIILHFGLATRRHVINVETLALNRLSVLHLDAAGRLAKDDRVLPGGASMRRAKVPVHRLDQALRQAGIPSRLSTSAGDYVCNQTFYLSLAMAEGTRRKVGFIHVPKRGPSELMRAAAVLLTALALGMKKHPSSVENA